MSWAIESSYGSSSRLPRGDNSRFHAPLEEEAFNDFWPVSSTNEAHIAGVPGHSSEWNGTPSSYASSASVAMNEAEREERCPRQEEFQKAEHEEDDDNEDSDSESTMEEFGLQYSEDRDAARESGEESDEAPEYPASRGGHTEPMRARNRSGPPIPPPVPVRPGQLFFSNQIWTRLNVEQQLKLGALKVGSKNKSFKTRPWLVVEKSNRVDSDGQQMLWVMCCTTRNRNGWEGVSYRDSKSFIPMAPTPSRFGRPVLPLVADDREVFLGGSLLFLEVFKEVKPGLLGDYIGHISDESVSIVNKEQNRIADERRKKEELRTASTATFKARGGSQRKSSERYIKHRAEGKFDQSESRRNSYSGHQRRDREGVIPCAIQPFQLPPSTNGTHVSPPLNPAAPPFHDPANQGRRGNRRKSFSGRGMQNIQQHITRHQNYPTINQTLDSGIHSPQNYGGRGNYGDFGSYSSPISYRGHEHHGNGGRRRSSTGGHGGYAGAQRNYGGHQNPGYFPDNSHDSGRPRWLARDGNRPTSPASGYAGYAGGNTTSHGWGPSAFTHGQPSWSAARQYQRR